MLNTASKKKSRIHYHVFVRQMCWHISFALIFFINFAGCRSLFTKWIHPVYNEDANGGEECLTFRPGTKQMWIVHSKHGRQRGTNKLTQTVIFAYAELSFLLSCGVHLRLSRSLSPFSPSNFIFSLHHLFQTTVKCLTISIHVSITVDFYTLCLPTAYVDAKKMGL